MGAIVEQKRYQFGRAGGTEPVHFKHGHEKFADTFEVSRDELRFHADGQGFTVKRGGELLKAGIGLHALENYLQPRIKDAPLDTHFLVDAHADGFALMYRRHGFEVLKGVLVLERAKELIGTTYVFGATDCSWLTMTAYASEEVELPHSSLLQSELQIVVGIHRDQVLPGDLLFYPGHVALFLDGQGEGRVIDTEPHDTAAPAGWPTPMLGVGVQIRPMSGNYYCHWPAVTKIGRVVSINGRPS